MITATVRKDTYQVDGLVNRGQWWGRTWLVGIGMGFDCCMVVVEADTEQDAIDELVDSRYGHLVKTTEPCTCDDPNSCSCDFAGNYGDRVNLDDIRILDRCKVNYFAQRDSIH